MKYLVTGAKGQLGREVVFALQAEKENVIGIGREELDLGKPEQVAESIASYHADWVINCAAHTHVDKAEENEAVVFKVNRDSAKAIAEGVSSYGGCLLHVSTDFIFDGQQSHPYSEEDSANPLGVYGQSKWEGEQGVSEIIPDALILRTAWVYGIQGHNFVKTVLRLASERDELRIVDDQVGAPSWTADITRAILSLIKNNDKGIFHFTNEGVASWYDFANEIVSIARNLGYPVKAQHVTPISTSEFPLPAKRPSYSVMSKKKIRQSLAYPIPHWRDSLIAMMEQLKASSL